MGFATKWKTKNYAQECSKRHIFLSHFFIFHHKPKRMLKFLRKGFWIVIVQKVRKAIKVKNAFFCFWSRDIGCGLITSWTGLYLPPMSIAQTWSNWSIHVQSYSNWFFPRNGIKRLTLKKPGEKREIAFTRPKTISMGFKSELKAGSLTRVMFFLANMRHEASSLCALALSAVEKLVCGKSGRTRFLIISVTNSAVKVPAKGIAWITPSVNPQTANVECSPAWALPFSRNDEHANP